jgi:dTDP-4-amino-4,6-dideoxygalactose transaminase
MGPIMRVATKCGLSVIEDAAQSITSTYKGRKAGSIGTCGFFSFFPSKNLGAAGDGGIIVTNDEKLNERMVLMRNHGAKPKYFHAYVGGNFRLDPLQAAILLVKLPHLEDWSEARRCNAEYYNERFADSPVEAPFVLEVCITIYNQYVIRFPQRDALLARLKQNNIGSEVYYPLPLHLQKCFAYLGYKDGSLPVAELAAREVLALPCYPELTPEMRAHVADSVLTGVKSLDVRQPAAADNR